MDNLEPDYLADSLLYLCLHYGVPTTRDALVAGLPLQDNRLSPSLFARAAARAGMTSKIVKKPLGRLHRSLLPSILLLKEEQVAI
jgi:ATP-binding cassette subfamily C protein LapB